MRCVNQLLKDFRNYNLKKKIFLTRPSFDLNFADAEDLEQATSSLVSSVKEQDILANSSLDLTKIVMLSRKLFLSLIGSSRRLVAGNFVCLNLLFGQ